MKPVRSILTALSVIVCGASSAHAQWLLNGSKVYYNSNNVGIGTSDPAYKLDVRTSAATRAIFGYNSATSGTRYGVFGQSNSTTGRGVYGLANASTGTNFGVYGKTNSPTGYAGYFAGNVGVTGWIGTKANAPVDIYSNNKRVLRIVDAVNSFGEFSPNLIGGAAGNFVTAGANGSTIGGGGGMNDGFNRVTDNYGTIGGGVNNQAGNNAGATSDAQFATVGGGSNNTASGWYSTVGGGSNSTASGVYSTVDGGDSNTASGGYSTVPGGYFNTANGSFSTVGGGYLNAAGGGRSTVGGGDLNNASGGYSTVPGGRSNLAGGDYSFAAGRRATAGFSGSFVWADSTDAEFFAGGPNGFNVRASGGVDFYSSANLSTGVGLAPGGGSWGVISDRAVKENIQPVDPKAALDKLLAIPISTWNYTTQDPSIRHIGPMAQDFHAAFGVGEDDTRITTIDADGVALAAIQGLHQIVKENEAALRGKDAQIAAQQHQIDHLAARLARLESIVTSIPNSNGAHP